MSLVESMNLEARRCEQSIHDSRRLSKEFNEVVALLTRYRTMLVRRCEILRKGGGFFESVKNMEEEMARIDKCLAALKGPQL